jgi:DnaJ homolog subfamily A member 2
MPYMTQVPNEGMPSLGNPFVKGNLYIAWHVKFPETLDLEVCAQLKKLLPNPAMEEEYDPEEVEEHFMETADLRHFGKGGAATSSGEYDSDEEGGPGGVQCQQS